jgi:tetratricopeptide (TPR) repeat protein
MKALANAEKDKKKLLQDDDNTNEISLELTPLESTLTNASRSEGQDTLNKTTKQKAAANIFHAAQPSKSHFSMAIIGLVVIITACIVWFSVQLLQLNSNESEVLMADVKQQTAPNTSISKPMNSVIAHQLERAIQQNNAVNAVPFNPLAPDQHVVSKPKQSAYKPSTVESRIDPNLATSTSTQTIKSSISHQPENDAEPAFSSDRTIIGEIGDATISDSDTPADTNEEQTYLHKQQTLKQKPTIQISRNQPVAHVDQTLLEAYKAFTEGDHRQAQQLYRQVLRKNTHQTDALLGMAAIAQNEGRNADAVGWYQKVLEIEPHNTVALSGVVNTMPKGNGISQESRLKNLIASQPQVASFHASLGNLYAAQEQWTQAQQAYFEANRYDNDNAEYAFNLAVSLEHLKKPTLALSHYQRALALVLKTKATLPDKDQIQARIDALQ